jgi:hypothetical protein
MSQDQPLTHAERGQIGAHVSWARTADRTARTSNGRRAFDAKFLAEVDPSITDPATRAKAAEHLRKAYYLRMAAASKAARAARLTEI